MPRSSIDDSPGRLASADESLLVSPLLSDFFVAQINHHNGHDMVRKNLQRDIEANADPLLKLKMPLIEEKKKGLMNEPSSPMNQSEDVSPSASANILQLDTSFCPSLGFGSVHSDSSGDRVEDAVSDVEDAVEFSNNSTVFCKRQASHEILTDKYCIERSFAFDESPVGTDESDRNIEGKTSDNESESQTRDEGNIQQFENAPMDHSCERSSFADPVIFSKKETRVEDLTNSCLSDTSLDNSDGYEEKSTSTRGSPSYIDEQNDSENDARVKQKPDFVRSLPRISGLCDSTDGGSPKEKNESLIDSRHMIQSVIRDSAQPDPVSFSTEMTLIPSPKCFANDVQDSFHQTKSSHYTEHDNNAHSLHNNDMHFSERVNLSQQNESENGSRSQPSGSTDDDGLYITTAGDPNDGSFSSNTSIECSQSKDTATLEELFKDESQLKSNKADLSDIIAVVNKKKYESHSNDDGQSVQSTSSDDLDASLWKSIHASNNPSVSSTIIKSDEPLKDVSKSSRKATISLKDVTAPNDTANQDNHGDLTSAKRPIDTTSGLELWRGAAHRRKLEVIQSQCHVTEPRLSSFKFAQFDNHSATRLRKTFVTTKPKKFPPEEDPYRPFKAKSLPNNLTGGVAGIPKVEKRSVTQPKSPQLGTRRKPDEASKKKEPPNTKQFQLRRASDFPTHPPPKKSLPIIKKKALEAEPFTRVLSGTEVSV